MAFTAYIFEEDFRRLTSDFKYSSVGGSLYGQWTSTGNPVIHVAFSYSLPKQHGMIDHLSESYKLCHIGEWRPVGGGPREVLLSKCRGRGTRFIVVDVAEDKIWPNLYEKNQQQQFRLCGQGKVEHLSGENPFNRVLRNPQAVRYDQPPHHQSAVAGQGQRSPGHARSQSQEIEIKSSQWYSSDRGNDKVTYVFQKFQENARFGQVEMSRDTDTHDMSMAFTDKHQFKKWEVKFPSNFPRDGATLVNKSQPVASHDSRYQTSYGSSFGGHGQAEQRVDGSAHLEEAVKNIICQIKKS